VEWPGFFSSPIVSPQRVISEAYKFGSETRYCIVPKNPGKIDISYYKKSDSFSGVTGFVHVPRIPGENDDPFRFIDYSPYVNKGFRSQVMKTVPEFDNGSRWKWYTYFDLPKLMPTHIWDLLPVGFEFDFVVTLGKIITSAFTNTGFEIGPPFFDLQVPVQSGLSTVQLTGSSKNFVDFTEVSNPGKVPFGDRTSSYIDRVVDVVQFRLRKDGEPQNSLESSIVVVNDFWCRIEHFRSPDSREPTTFELSVSWSFHPLQPFTHAIGQAIRNSIPGPLDLELIIPYWLFGDSEDYNINHGTDFIFVP